MCRLFLLLVGASVSLSSATAQPVPDTLPSDSINTQESVEQVLDAWTTDEQTSNLTAEVLSHLADNPLDINRARVPDLSAIPSLSSSLARRIVRHRTEQGSFSRVGELTRVDGLDESRLRSLRPYVTVTASEEETGDQSGPYPSVPSFRTIRRNLDVDVLQRVTRDLDLGRGFEDDTSHTTFQGSPERLTTRIRLGYERRLQLAMTLDKDPGEAIRWDPRTDTYGFDHVAGNVTLRDWGRLETLVIGDFGAEYGQGVALWQGLGFGKGRNPVSPLLRNGRGIVPFQSTTENGFFRGMAATLAVTPSLSVSGFVSRRNRDATLDSVAAPDASNGPLPARTLSTGGLHRTSSEVRRKSTFGKKTAGGAIESRIAFLHLGATVHQSWFDRPLQPPANQPYRHFEVSGTRAAMGSVFATAYLSEYTLFGELAKSQSGSLGGVAGASLNDEASVEAILMARLFPRDFGGLYNAAVAERGATQNETGVYSGLRVQVAKRWRIGAYVDQYRFPWLRFSVPRPSRGLDTRLVVEYEPRPWLSSYVQVRAEREETGTEHTDSHGRALSALRIERRQSVRWHTEYDFSDALTLRTRLQFSRFAPDHRSPAHGTLLSQGVRFNPTETLRLDAGLTFFDTDGFESRIYAYERDLLYSFSVPVLFDRGQRSYLLARYAPTTSLTVEAKYGVTRYPHRKRIGSGLNQRTGTRDRELRFQVRWRY